MSEEVGMSEEKKGSADLVIGVTGSPGSGKSTVAAAFAALGAGGSAPLDDIGHELLAEPDVRDEIQGAFSSGVFRIMDGEISRKKLADVVFSNEEDLARLNRILHPRIVEGVRAALDEWRDAAGGEGPAGGAPEEARPRAFVIEGALLLEMGLADMCDRIVLVRASREERLARLARTRNWEDAELSRRERAQLDDEARAEEAQAVIDNASTLDELRRKVEALWEEWK